MLVTRSSRGQTLPFWAMGIAAALALAFAGVQYGEILRWQIRAQNAADAAASAALAAQTQTWNQQLALLYAANVEEWRMKGLLEGMTAALYGDPGCGGASGGVNSAGCIAAFNALRDQYEHAVVRYTTDAQLINRVSNYTTTQAENDAAAIVAQLKSDCGTAAGGDCAFGYSVTAVPRIQPVNDVEQDGGAWVINNPGVPGQPKADYTPLQVEVVTCANIKPAVPSFLQFQVPSFRAIGRAAATSAMVTQEWIQPGVIVNPRTGLPFQTIEPLTGLGFTPTATGPNGWNWFTTNFGGNPAQSWWFLHLDAYSESINNPEFSVVTGWWNTVPIKPWQGQLNTGNMTCAGS